MRIGRVIGQVTLSHHLDNLKAGQLLIVDALDGDALAGHLGHAPRSSAMPESLVVFDEWGAGVGQLIAISEGGEAMMPFRPQSVPIDAYCTAILDTVETTYHEKVTAA